VFAFNKLDSCNWNGEVVREWKSVCFAC